MVRIGSLLLGVFLLGGCGGAAAEPAGAPGRIPAADADFHYEVRLAPDVSRLDVTLCPRGRLERLVPSRDDAIEHLESVEVRPARGEPRALEVEDGVVPIEDLAPGDCVHYRVDLAEAAGASRYGEPSDGNVVVQAGQWLWRPSPRTGESKLTLVFDLPRGTKASAPWPRRGGLYRIEESAFRFLGYTAFGDFATQELAVGRCDVGITRLPGELAITDDELRTYVQRAAEAVRRLHGTMPTERVEVIVVPVNAGPDPVAFGHVGRGGGGSVALLVRENASLEALLSDWVLVHELSHLAMPYVRREDAWLSEGFATYYQEVLLARGELVEPVDAWRALEHGFASGRRNGNGWDLRTESERMYRTHAFRRVYWGGAAYALDLDVALRREGSSLDDVMRGLGALEQLEAWPAERVLAEMDRIVGSTTPSRLAREHLAMQEVPTFDDLYAALGLRREDGALVLAEDAPAAQIRTAITSPP